MDNFQFSVFNPIALLLLLVAGCGYYSFTGATVASHLNTIAVPLVEDMSVSPVTNMDAQMTDLLVERFVRQTRLSLEPSENEADVILTARIERYTNEPTSVGGELRATRNRVSVSVSVRYVDRVEDRELLQRTFTSFEDYDPAAGLDQERVAAFAALRNIADDVFTAATSNW
jgi:hypothetical protein